MARKQESLAKQAAESAMMRTLRIGDSQNGATLRTRVIKNKKLYNRNFKHKKSFANAEDFSFANPCSSAIQIHSAFVLLSPWWIFSFTGKIHQVGRSSLFCPVKTKFISKERRFAYKEACLRSTLSENEGFGGQNDP